MGPDYAHAEARKSPALDGKVERDSEGKEVRYPVMLSAMEKLVARKVCLAFKVSRGIAPVCPGLFVPSMRMCIIDTFDRMRDKNVSCSPLAAANCVWLRSSPSQRALLCL